MHDAAGRAQQRQLAAMGHAGGNQLGALGCRRKHLDPRAGLEAGHAASVIAVVMCDQDAVQHQTMLGQVRFDAFRFARVNHDGPCTVVPHPYVVVLKSRNRDKYHEGAMEFGVEPQWVDMPCGMMCSDCR